MNAVFGSSTLRDMALTFQENVKNYRSCPIRSPQDVGHGEICAAKRPGSVGLVRIKSKTFIHYPPCNCIMLLDTPKTRESLQIGGIGNCKRYAAPQHIDLERLRALWNSAIRRHPILRTRIVNSTSGVFQAVLQRTPCLPAGRRKTTSEQLHGRDKSDNTSIR